MASKTMRAVTADRGGDPESNVHRVSERCGDQHDVGSPKVMGGAQRAGEGVRLARNHSRLARQSGGEASGDDGAHHSDTKGTGDLFDSLDDP